MIGLHGGGQRGEGGKGWGANRRDEQRTGTLNASMCNVMWQRMLVYGLSQRVADRGSRDMERGLVSGRGRMHACWGSRNSGTSFSRATHACI